MPLISDLTLLFSSANLLELQLLCRKEEEVRKKQVASEQKRRHLLTHWAAKL